MKTSAKITTLAVLTTFVAGACSPMAFADSKSVQKDKNNMRNLGIAGAAVAGYGLLKGNTAATVLGAAAGGYGAYKYEKDRKAQSEANRSRSRYYHHSSGNYTSNGRKYYTYNGHQYYMDRSDGSRHMVR